ncbi:MAG: hypothetical protein ABWZ52_01510 [Acidimicrobiales bacterium]
MTDPVIPSGLPEEIAVVLRAWARSPSSHPLLGDWRRVGYRRGVAEPRATGPIVEAHARGVPADDPDDASGHLQALLEEIGAAGGGVLQLGAGRYALDNPLFVHHSNVVLAGAGKGQTTLYFTRPLAESLYRPPPPPPHGAQLWSWTGGQIFFTSRERLAASVASDWAWGDAEGWLAGDTLATVAPAPRGTQVLLVDDSSGLTPGEMVLLEVTDTPTSGHRMVREMGGDVDGARAYPWQDTTLDEVTWTWPVVVTEVLSPRTIAIEQPLRITIHAETPARLRTLGPTVHDSGVEGLTIENRLLVQTEHNDNPGSNGVCFQAVHDCWATDVHVVNADIAFSMTSAKSCTLSGISAGGRSLHHFTASRVRSHDNLTQDFVLEEFTVPAVPGSYLHGISVEDLSSGNVWRRGVLHTGTFDSHRELPFENLRTDITLVNKDGVVGGGFDKGPLFGARTVHWGITVTGDETLAMDITDVAPRSLTAGVTGLSETGSRLRGVPSNAYFLGELESERLAFRIDLGAAKDLLAVQRALLPLP